MMKRIIVLAVLCILCPESITVPRAAPLQSTVPAAIAAPVPVMPLAEVRAGMQGVIRTVFRGDQIDEFSFEVLGVMKNALGPKQDIILVQLKGEKPEFTGVVAGMSGSPAYINSRLIGALSLRFGSFAKEPIAGLTPIESMLSVFKIDEQKPRRAAAATGSDPALEGPVPDRTDGRPAKIPTDDPSRPTILLEPVPTPLFCTGFRQEVVDRFAPLFRQHNLVPVQGGGASASSAEFRPERAAGFVPDPLSRQFWFPVTLDSMQPVPSLTGMGTASSLSAIRSIRLEPPTSRWPARPS